MIYNDFHGDRLSRLGFGCMRFAGDPATGGLNQQLVNDMFRTAIEGGVNYFDTAYVYNGGKSETTMAEALKPYPRESYFLADKFPGHSMPGPVDNFALFDISLQRCNTGYFDYYLLHNVNESTVKVYESEEYHILPDVLKIKEQGKIRHLGFSYHGGTELLEEYLTRHEGVFEFVQIQCNYLDWTLQSAKEKYEIIQRHGLDVWVMEPLRGGKLANLPAAQAEKLAALQPGASCASFGMRFLQDLPGIKMILSGMNALPQVEDNLATFAEHKPLGESEREALFAVAEALKSSVPCTGCRYCCAGCPLELNIPLFLEIYNNYKFDMSAPASQDIRIFGLPEDKLPSACVQCGQCSGACPQKIDVPAVLAELSDMMVKSPRWADMVKARAADIQKDLQR